MRRIRFVHFFIDYVLWCTFSGVDMNMLVWSKYRGRRLGALAVNMGSQKQTFRMRMSKWKVRDTGKVVLNVLNI